MSITNFPAGELLDIGFVCIYSKHKDKWVLCWHKKRESWECPGGHVESGESALEAAKRELFEETGAIDYTITPLWDYEYIYEDGTGRNNGRVYFAEIKEFGKLPQNEMGEVGFFQSLPMNVTYDRIKMKENLDRVEKYLLAHRM